MTQAAATLDPDFMRGIAALSRCSSEPLLIEQLQRLGRSIVPEGDLHWTINGDCVVIVGQAADAADLHHLLTTLAEIGTACLRQLRRDSADRRARSEIMPGIERCLAEEQVDVQRLKPLLTHLAALLGLPLLACYLAERTGGYRLLAGSWTQSAQRPPLHISEQALPPAVNIRQAANHQAVFGLIVAATDSRSIPECSAILDLLQQVFTAARERVELTRSRQRYLDQMTALHGFSLALNRRPLPESLILNLTAAGMRELSNAATVYIMIRRSVDTEPELLTLDGFSTPFPPELAQLQPQIPGDGRPLVHEGSTTTLVLPLYSRPERRTAMLLVYGTDRPSDADLEMLLLFATQASAALEANALLEQLRHTNEQLDTVLSVTHDCLVLIGTDSRIRLANRAFIDVLRGTGVDPEVLAHLEGLRLHQLIIAWQAAAGWSADAVNRLFAAVDADPASDAEPARHGILHRPGLDLAWTAVRPEYPAAATWSALVTLRDITAAAQTERLREELSDMIVHDLRSPLTSVLSSFELSLRTDVAVNPTTFRQVLTVGRQAALRLLNIVNMMLDINRLENGSLPLEPVAVTLEELIGNVCDVVELIAAQKGQRFVRSISHPDCAFTADQALVSRLLQNLLDNAVKFTPPGGTVCIEAECISSNDNARETGGVVRIAVLDTGPGIAAHALETVFEKFTQLRQKREGHGLGLTFCKLVADAHGGRIWVENRSEGGSAFHVELPRIIEAAAQN